MQFSIIMRKTKILSIIGRFWISITVCTFILVMCVIKTEELPQPPVLYFDKLVHFLMFMGVAGIVFFDNTYYLRRAVGKRQIFLGSFLVPFLLGGVIEILQGYFLPHRSGDYLDFLFNTVGIGAGILVCLLINRFLKPGPK
jgi:VanZ family protein